MPPKEKKEPKNTTRKKLKPSLDVLGQIFEFNPIQGISPNNKLLDALSRSKAVEEDVVVGKKGKLVLNRDNIEKYILDVLSQAGCDKNYQYTPDQQDRFDELSKLPASTNKADKNSLKKELATIIDVPLSALENTKKFGLPTQPDFVKVILCLEKHKDNDRKEQEEAKEEETKEVETKEVETKEVEVEEAKDSVVPIKTTEETRKVFEGEGEGEGEQSESFLSTLFTKSKSKVESPTPIESVLVPDVESKEYNEFLSQKELQEHENLKSEEGFQFLYPDTNDSEFNLKIARHKEFNETKYDGTIYDIEEHAKKLCNTEFELTPHQLFVKNFLSLQTPYNCLLLYHGLGTGKTCSSIGIAEEMRAYIKQVGITQPILIVASPNVQQNYRLQLFDERKLKLESGLWKLNTCIGNSLLSEVNPTNITGIPKDRIISEINSIIDKYYRFMGYVEIANYIKRVLQMPPGNEGSRFNASELKELKIKKIRKYFDNRLIVIDEVHNIRISEEQREESKTASLLMDVARYANNMRLLLLSATPMYNNHKEIIWLTNLINTVDKHSTIKESDVFDKEGNFKVKEKSKKGGLDVGKELLIRKLTGYVSYVRGENPYTFPYRIYPDVFSPENSLDFIKESTGYPSLQMNNREIEEPLENIPVFITSIGEYQAKGYDFLMNHMRNKSYNVVNKFGEERELPSFENMESFGYTYLLKPLEALDIVFPNKKLDGIDSLGSPSSTSPNEFEDQQNEEIVNQYIGKKGLANTMNYTIQRSPYPNVYDFEYKPSILNDPNHGRIFHPDNIGKYSNKIAKICECIKKSKGIVLIYSQYIEGSIIPIALALEEMGLNRFSSANYAKSLFKTPPTEPVDSITMKTRAEFTKDNEKGEFNAARYVMITGNKAYSPDNLEDIKYVTNPNNLNGEKVKVVIISKAGSEGLDFKCIRQIHIMDPWYNMSRIEQIIGRGVRNFSHCMLANFKERNVEIYLHSTLPRNDEEPADLYVYRFAEKKAKLIGRVNRVLKEISVDCLLNIGQHNFTIDQLNSLANNKKMKIHVSSKRELIDYQIGDRDYSDICDYDVCKTDFTCNPTGDINEIISDTYNEEFANMNHSIIVKRIRDLFKKQLSYGREQLINEINILKQYPEIQIDFALSRFINNKNEYIYDEYGRSGYLINKDKFYVFQPVELTDEGEPLLEKSIPVDYKRTTLEYEIEKPTAEPVLEKDEELDEHQYIIQKYQEIVADIDNCLVKVETARTNKPSKKVTKESDWYINLGYIYEFLVDKHKMDSELVNKFIVYHYLDTLPIQDRLLIIQYFYSGENDSVDSVSSEKLIRNYFEEKIVKVRGNNAVVLAVDSEDKQGESGRKKVFIQTNEDKWIWADAQPTDEMDAKRQSAKKLLIPLSGMNSLFGFMQVLKDAVVFKTLDSSAKARIGSVCNVEGKKDVIKRINMISDIKYSDKGTDTDVTVNSKEIVKQGLCVILEILFRYYDDIKKNNKRWFLNNEQDPFE